MTLCTRGSKYSNGKRVPKTLIATPGMGQNRNNSGRMYIGGYAYAGFLSCVVTPTARAKLGWGAGVYKGFTAIPNMIS